MWVVLLLLLLCVVALWAATLHVRIEAKTDSVEIEFSPGHPITWALDGARFLDCWQLAGDAGVRNIKRTSRSVAEIELTPIEEVSKHLSTVRARVSVDGNDLVIELEPVVREKDNVTAMPPGCSKDASRVAVLDTGDGVRRGINLPAQLRMGRERIGNGLTLEFRGRLRVGNDVTSSRQPLLKSGRLTLREVRSHRLHTVADAQFDIESRDLGLGDKVTLSLGEVSEDAPQGFVHIVKGEKSTEMSVYATAVAERARIVRPFSQPEEPKANLFKRLLTDELLSKLAAVIVALGGLVRLFFAKHAGVPDDS